MKSVKLSSYAIGLACMFVAGSAAAQAQAQGEVGMTLPGQQPQQAAVAAAESDHDAMIGRLAVGYLGRRTMLIASTAVDPGPPPTAGQDVVDAPVIGIRYWVDQMIGIDAGVGFLITSGSTEAGPPVVTVDDAGITAFLLHAGVPLSLASAGHFSFQIVPEVNVGFASRSQSIPDPAAPGSSADTDMSGFHLDVGLRAGAEIHFGFIDIPQLSLQGSIGVRYALDNTSVTDSTTPATVERTVDRSTSSFGTTVGDNPWNIFTSNVAALYYF